MIAGLARGDSFPDALSGGAHIAALGGPMLLTPTDSLDGRVNAYLCGGDVQDMYVYGGTSAVAASVVGDIDALILGEACAA